MSKLDGIKPENLSLANHLEVQSALVRELEERGRQAGSEDGQSPFFISGVKGNICS